jgi:hypothetical protein
MKIDDSNIVKRKKGENGKAIMIKNTQPTPNKNQN